MAQSINITELNLPQLEMLKNQLDQTESCSAQTGVQWC
uniref:Prefoldin subunit 5 n=1 Tax=Rhinopithecus bieti TaxID=61621 RepID=A0A2K6L5X1_RHIBE